MERNTRTGLASRTARAGNVLPFTLPRAATTVAEETLAAPAMRIATLRGLVRADRLVAGERVITRRGVQTVQAVTRPARAEVEQIPFVLIPTGALGGNRPLNDLRVPATQRIFLSPGGETLSAGALAEARSIPAHYCETPAEIVQLTFAQDAVLQVEDIQMVCPARR